MRSVTVELRYPDRTVEEVREILGDPDFRQAVCAFQQVEDQLVASRLLGAQQALREQASQAADLVEQQVLNRYRAGQVGYTEVVIAQVSALNARRALAQAGLARQTAAVALIRALGGGWDVTQLESAQASR